MTDREAIDWLKAHKGKLRGYIMADCVEVYRLAIEALEGRQAMKETAKNSNKKVHTTS